MPPIIYEKKGNIAFITINRPERRNALNFEAFGLLAKAWLDFRDDPELWVAIITGAGDKAFCAGGDLKEFIHMVTQNISELTGSGGSQTLGGDVPVNASLVAVLREVEIYKPIIAAVNGFCIAGRSPTRTRWRSCSPPSPSAPAKRTTTASSTRWCRPIS